MLDMPHLAAVAAAKIKNRKEQGPAAAAAGRLARVGVGRERKMEVVVAKRLPMAMYGVEQAEPQEAKVRQLTTAISGCISGKHQDRKIVNTFECNRCRRTSH